MHALSRKMKNSTIFLGPASGLPHWVRQIVMPIRIDRAVQCGILGAVKLPFVEDLKCPFDNFDSPAVPSNLAKLLDEKSLISMVVGSREISLFRIDGAKIVRLFRSSNLFS